MGIAVGRDNFHKSDMINMEFTLCVCCELYIDDVNSEHDQC